MNVRRESLFAGVQGMTREQRDNRLIAMAEVGGPLLTWARTEIDRGRYLLWMRHGCPPEGLYGDDGEMQCHACGIDFKRDPVEQVYRRFVDLAWL